VRWGHEMSPKSAIFIFPLATLHVFHTQTSCITHNFIFTLLDELSTCVVLCWCISRVVCTCENDLVSLASYTKLPSPRTLCMNVIHRHMFGVHHSKSIPICLEWYSHGITCIVSSCIFHVSFHLENFQVITTGVQLQRYEGGNVVSHRKFDSTSAKLITICWCMLSSAQDIMLI
jgi:hypothetical protein